MPEKNQIQSLEAFGLGEELDARQKGGIGLGLPLTKKLVELHGGDFSVQSASGLTCASLMFPPWRLQATADVVGTEVEP